MFEDHIAKRRQKELEQHSQEEERLTKEKEAVADKDKSVTINFKVPDESVPNLSLVILESEFDKMTIEHLKNLVALKHEYKPSANVQRMLYAGK